MIDLVASWCSWLQVGLGPKTPVWRCGGAKPPGILRLVSRNANEYFEAIWESWRALELRIIMNSCSTASSEACNLERMNEPVRRNGGHILDEV